LSNIRTHGGVLVYEVTIGTSGNVTDVRLVRHRERSGPSARIADLWRNAIQDWTFEPTVVHDSAVAVCMTVTVTIDV
jgi:outer membrane biosynthesis protein TonB